MKCDVNLFKNDDIKFITFISIIHRQYMIYLNNCLKKEGITASHAPILSYLLYKDISCQEEIGNHLKQIKEVQLDQYKNYKKNNLLTRKQMKTTEENINCL